MEFPRTDSLEAIVVLQARMASKRLPGKILKKLQGIPMLAHSIKRLKKIDATELVVATSEYSRDDKVAELAESEGALCFRGSEEDVLDRFYNAAKNLRASIVIRATGDNPLVDPLEAGRVLNAMISGSYDYVAGFNEVDDRKLPVGVGVEAMTFNALERAWNNGTRPEHREHINNYFIDNQDTFKCHDLKCLPEHSCPELSLTVDTPDDFTFIQNIGKGLGDLTNASTEDVIEYWKNSRKNSGG